MMQLPQQLKESRAGQGVAVMKQVRAQAFTPTANVGTKFLERAALSATQGSRAEAT
jgi:hypothetical protein